MITLTSYQWTDDFFGQWLKVGREYTDLLPIDHQLLWSGMLELNKGSMCSRSINGWEMDQSREARAQRIDTLTRYEQWAIASISSSSKEDRPAHLLQTAGNGLNQHGSSSKEDQHTHFLRTVGNDLDQHGSSSKEDRHTHVLRTVGNDLDQHGSSSKEDRHTHILRTVGNDLDQHGSSSKEDRHTHFLRTVGNDLDQHGSSSKEDRHTHVLRTVSNDLDQHAREDQQTYHLQVNTPHKSGQPSNFAIIIPKYVDTRKPISLLYPQILVL
jgi:hypothetical protein